MPGTEQSYTVQEAARIDIREHKRKEDENPAPKGYCSALLGRKEFISHHGEIQQAAELLSL